MIFSSLAAGARWCFTLKLLKVGFLKNTAQMICELYADNRDMSLTPSLLQASSGLGFSVSVSSMLSFSSVVGLDRALFAGVLDFSKS